MLMSWLASVRWVDISCISFIQQSETLVTRCASVVYKMNNNCMNCCKCRQGSTIYSETAAANYENAGLKGVFESQIPNVPAKRLGTTEEV